MDIRIIKWNQHPDKCLACYLKWIILVISKPVVITDGGRFCDIKETDNNHSRWKSFQFRFNSSAEIVCNQLNFSRNIYVFSRILAEFFSLRDNSANPNRAYQPIFFPRHPYFFRLQIGSLQLNEYSYVGYNLSRLLPTS